VRRLRVGVLVHRDLVPPASLEGIENREIQKWKTEYDVASALELLGHEVRVVGVADDLSPIRELVESWKPHVVFNLLMEFRDVGAFQVHVASYLELLGIPYTGCNPRGILLSRDKAVTKKILRYHRIPTPAFAVFRLGRVVRAPGALRFPLIVKSVDEEASFGIAQASLVRNEAQLAERVAFIHESVRSDALAEEYIEGREITQSLIGNRRLETFPAWEMVFENLPEASVAIATERAKWDLEYQKRVGIDIGPARKLPQGVDRRIARAARRIYRALGLSGYARIDLRLAEDGRFFVLEANATPDVAQDEEFASAAHATGLDYPALIQRIVNLGRRYQAPWDQM
jgi:D-alanine-D-alanine ligase